MDQLLFVLLLKLFLLSGSLKLWSFGIVMLAKVNVLVEWRSIAQKCVEVSILHARSTSALDLIAWNGLDILGVLPVAHTSCIEASITNMW
jgi:hypothetical protein